MQRGIESGVVSSWCENIYVSLVLAAAVAIAIGAGEEVSTHLAYPHGDAFECVGCGSDIEVEAHLLLSRRRKGMLSGCRGCCAAESGCSACVKVDDVAYSVSATIHDPVVSVKGSLVAGRRGNGSAIRTREKDVAVEPSNSPKETFDPCLPCDFLGLALEADQLGTATLFLTLTSIIVMFPFQNLLPALFVYGIVNRDDDVYVRLLVSAPAFALEGCVELSWGRVHPVAIAVLQWRRRVGSRLLRLL